MNAAVTPDRALENISVPHEHDLRIQEHLAVAAQLGEFGLTTAWTDDIDGGVVLFPRNSLVVITWPLDPAEAERQALRLWHQTPPAHSRYGPAA